MDDKEAMQRALELGSRARAHSSPNPWVGCVILAGDAVFEGATSPPGGLHAEAAALHAAGDAARGATLYSSLEPCAHFGRTPPCADAIAASGIKRVVVAIQDPDPNVQGRGLRQLREAGIEVVVGQLRGEAEAQLAPYLKHRRTGRPWVVLKLAAALDGRIAAPDGSSRWITGPEAREDAHRLRAESDAVLVGAGTVRHDDPLLTVRRSGAAPESEQSSEPAHQPLRVVLGTPPRQARVSPALEVSGELDQVLEDLGDKGVVQLLVEGGAKVAHDFHAARLVDRYVIYLAPALFGGDDGVPLFRGPGAPEIDQVWRGRFVAVERLGRDVRLELAPAGADEGEGA